MSEELVRNRRKLSIDSSTPSDSQPGGTDNASIQKYEQQYDALDFKINPGSKRVKEDPRLKAKDHLLGIYNELYAKRDKWEAIKADKTLIKSMDDRYKVADEYASRLKKLGFRLPKLPAWLKKSWRPKNSLRPDGVPRNHPDTKMNRHTANTDIDSPLDNPQEDTSDDGGEQFPGELKKKDGTTTGDENNVSPKAKDNNQDANGSSDSGSSDNATGPSQMWSDLTQAWDDILDYKNDIYVDNAEDLFKIHVIQKQINKMSSVGSKKHFREVN